MNWEPTLSRLGQRLADTFSRGRVCVIPPAPASAEALLVLSLDLSLRRTIVWIAAGARALESNHENIMSLCQGEPPAKRILFYPAWESLPGQPAGQDPEMAGSRLGVLCRLRDASEPLVVATCVQALMQGALSRETLHKNTLTMRLGCQMELDDLVRALEATHYRFEPEVSEKGQASVRGGIADVWPLTEAQPLRLEFDGPVLQSARIFSPLDQRSIRAVEQISLTPASEWEMAGSEPAAEGGFLSHLPDDAVFVWSDMPSVEHHAAAYNSMLPEAGSHGSMTFEELRGLLAERKPLELVMGGQPDQESPAFGVSFSHVEGVLAAPADPMTPDVMETMRGRFLSDLRLLADKGHDVYLFFNTKGSMERYMELHPKDMPAKVFHPKIGAISEGFKSDELRVAVVSENELYGHRKTARGRYDPGALADHRKGVPTGARVAEPSDLRPGDYVVHIQHGIGRYAGLRRIMFDGLMQEVLTIEYANGVLLHVPVSQAHLLSLYVGISGHAVTLHQLGGRRWLNEKEEAGLAIEDFAASLIDIQAARQVLEGHAFKPDTPWQREFEAAFPYRETPDQEQAIVEVKKDMENKRPMDRLICGDVGFGKTEIAIRAAFKAAMEGKQVAVLVPTTVLCQQHYDTFCGRMAAYPVRVEMLSRFCPRGRRDSILGDLRSGLVDIVIGTHCLLQPGVEFSDLGLVVIDEEQRFGVRHKEQLKHMRRLVDVLTMTATPIPRTLYMSLVGSKDLSTVQTPPEHRLPIETIIAENTDDVVRSAILRELGRDGQVFYLHNRVMTIGKAEERLGRVVPEARVSVAHGQMSAGELAEVMGDFVAGNSDVLLCTTIIESGLDIPNVNTILIDRADRFGLADLYQLRGRIGRSIKKGYAYLLLPAFAKIDPAARKRMLTLRKYSELGSGFRLAMRDLELRGAGSLLGTEQSGHIAAIGFLLYCQLLRRTIARMNGEHLPPVVDVALKLDFVSLSPDDAEAGNAAVIPRGYITEERLRIGAYRDVAAAGTKDELKKLRTSLADRYGPLPRSLGRLLKLAEIRVVAAGKGISSIETAEDRVMLMRNGDYVMQGTRHPRMSATAVDARLSEILRLVNRLGLDVSS